jgi:hypothetical protein
MNSARTVAPASDTDTSFRPFEAGERGPGLTPSSPQDVRSGDRLENPGPRVRYVMERGSGSAGTAYNKLDFEVLDRHAMPGRQLVCRTSQAFARLITYALNRVIPT